MTEKHFVKCKIVFLLRKMRVSQKIDVQNYTIKQHGLWPSQWNWYGRTILQVSYVFKLNTLKYNDCKNAHTLFI